MGKPKCTKCGMLVSGRCHICHLPRGDKDLCVFSHAYEETDVEIKVAVPKKKSGTRNSKKKQSKDKSATKKKAFGAELVRLQL